MSFIEDRSIAVKIFGHSGTLVWPGRSSPPS
jgi:hypothetical protein